MTRILKSKYKVDRRLRCNLWGRPKSPFNRRDYPPGLNGQNKRRKPSDYGIQLNAKQKLKCHYGYITEKQFRNLFQKASKIKGNTSENLIELLERRLDAAVYRMKFVTTIFAARQFVSHGHINVNGKTVNIPSYSLKDGDVVELSQKSKEIPIVLEAISSTERDAPEYLSVDYDKMKGTFLKGPKPDEVPYPVVMEPNLVIEYYSR
jgi:small subunit ribosomal protein S4|tara:strand:+ start:607 stop:1224 length:618 start_codon:yes stop_codon:yes gene_type:complete